MKHYNIKKLLKRVAFYLCFLTCPSIVTIVSSSTDETIYALEPIVQLFPMIVLPPNIDAPE